MFFEIPSQIKGHNPILRPMFERMITLIGVNPLLNSKIPKWNIISGENLQKTLFITKISYKKLNKW
ncbi:hypothetical protein [Leptospira dzoumogneensis]|uniref:Uncharacterized protein n=1 Tax=Leptospira dzoumogneensis TaxID=2484904 RepID=A0A4Z1A994_9LEPT|nr:hypothetical protein [Leptospira dzoumogneensis]TGM95167.1 hypothetical protein EHR06_18840 [Leptospira dzoumogneensis]